jgi:hypothetical protein
MTEPRRTRRYAPRPEKISLDWPSAFKIAVAVVMLSVVLQLIVWAVFGAGLAFLLAAGA